MEQYESDQGVKVQASLETEGNYAGWWHVVPEQGEAYYIHDEQFQLHFRKVSE